MNILLIRLRLVGDVVFTTPAIRAVRRHFPDARLTYLVERPAAPVVTRGNPHLDEVIVIERGSRPSPAGSTTCVLARQLRKLGVSIWWIDLHGGPR